MSLYDDILVLFPTAKNNGKYCRVPCPYHRGGNERHPSMSVILEEGHNGMHLGQCVCFACGWKGTFADIAESFGLQYVPETYVSEPETNRPILRLTTQQAVYKKDVPYQYSPYLAKRGIFEDVQRQFRVYEKPEEHKVYMPVFDKHEKYLFANARSTQFKAYFIDENAGSALSGIDLVDISKPIAICESQINVMTLLQAGFARGVATLGTTKVALLNQLTDCIGPFLLMYDGDEHGRKAARQAEQILGEHRCITFSFHEGEDVNSLWVACNFDQDKFFEELEDRQLPF